MIEAIKVNPRSLSRTLDLPVEKVEAAANLLYEGLSVPFILRYRKDQTQLTDAELLKLAAAYDEQRKFCDRKYSYLKTFEAQGKLTPELENMIIETRSPHRLDDLYIPFKAKTAVVPQEARAKGLEPLAQAIMNAADANVSLEELAAPYVDPAKNVATAEDALKGAAAIIAEAYSENFELRQNSRGFILRSARVVSKRAEQVEENAAETWSVEASAESVPAEENAQDVPAVDDEKAAKKRTNEEARVQQQDKLYSAYYDASFDLRRLTRDQIQTLNRGESARVLSVSLDVDKEKLYEIAKTELKLEGRPYAEYLVAAARDAVDSYLLPALDFETRRDLVDGALEQSLENVCSALANKLMQRPLPRRRVLAVDCAYRNACKIAALDEFGNLLAVDTITLRGQEERCAASVEKIVDLVKRFKLSVFALRSGSGRPKTVDSFFANLIAEHFANDDVLYIDVNDVGLDSYASGEIAQKELPNLETPERAAVSLGRRLINPLEEYVKVSPEFLCDEPFCRKLRVKTLRDVLGRVVSRCVNCVGVDVNAASAETLSYVVGLTPLSVKNIIEYRRSKGPFRSREEFKEVDGVSDSTYRQCAGFMRVIGGDNPLDATWIHPESYPLATAILEKYGFTVDDLRCAQKRAAFAEATKDADYAQLAAEFSAAGPLLVADVVAELATPGRDVRDSQPYPIFKKNLVKLEDLKPGMELTGRVSHVVDYGAFIDFGGITSGMAHVSRLSASHVRDARDVLAVGDTVKAWVLDVDLERERVGLTLVSPSLVREPREKRSFNRKPREERQTGDREQRRPRRPRPEGASDENRAEKGDRRERGERGGERRERNERLGGQRRDNNRPPRSAQVSPKQKAAQPLSEEKKTGKQQLQGFDELKEFFGL
ncbi:MAG: helix-hairpin-helix domain-containing protein [Thermoguttaceae bacterium]